MNIRIHIHALAGAHEMGDAGPPTPPPVLVQDRPGIDTIETPDESPLKEVRVLVTGFGVSFFSFVTGLFLCRLPQDVTSCSLVRK